MVYVSIVLVIIAIIIFIVRFYLAEKAEKEFAKAAFLIVFVISSIFLFFSTIVMVDTGNVGVDKLFGKVDVNSVREEGLSFKNPFKSVKELSVRTQTYTMSAKSNEGDIEGDDSIVALSKEGVELTLEVTLAFALSHDDSAWMYQKLGSNYVEAIVRPAARSSVREAVGNYTAQESYSSKRTELQISMLDIFNQKIKEILSKNDGYNSRIGIIAQSVLLRDVKLPKTLKESIEKKLAREQESLEMDFIIAREIKEKERKKHEAEGIKEFQQIVSEGISDQLLKWKGIEATKELANSKNAKIVVIGGADGLPLILGNN